MTGQRWNQRAQTIGKQVLRRGRQLFHEGNTRHIVVKRDGQRVFAIPLTIGLALGAFSVARTPRLTLIGLLAVMLAGFTFQIERALPPVGDGAGP